MNYLKLSALTYAFLFSLFPKAYAHSTYIPTKKFKAQGKDSHSVLPGDLASAACLSSIESKIRAKELSVMDIYDDLMLKGHDISNIITDGRFSKTHILDIYKAILLMPKWLEVGSQTSTGVKYKVDDGRDAVAWMYKGTLTINPLRWNVIVGDMRTSIIYHELAHLLGLRIYDVDSSLTWQNIDGTWRVDSLRRDGSIFRGRPLNPANFVSNYAMTNPAEDFAESVSSYRIKARVLKETSPKKYEFIKESIFLGIEFLDESNCNLPAEDVVDLEASKQFFLSKLKESNKHYDLAYRYASRSRLRDSAAREMRFRRAVMRSVLNSLGYGRQTSLEQYKKKNQLRVYMRTLKTLSDYKEFETQYSRDLMRKLASSNNMFI